MSQVEKLACSKIFFLTIFTNIWLEQLLRTFEVLVLMEASLLIIKFLNILFHIWRVQINVVISSFVAPIAYILFILFMKFSLRNQNDHYYYYYQNQNQDWSIWIARGATSINCFLVVLSMMILDKKNPEKVDKTFHNFSINIIISLNTGI